MNTESKEIRALDKNNWRVGNYNFQTLPAAMLFAGTGSEKLVDLYDESLKVFSCSDHGKTHKTSAGDYYIERERDSKLFSRNRERLAMLAFETKLKKLVLTGMTIENALIFIKSGDDLPESTKKAPFGRSEK